MADLDGTLQERGKTYGDYHIMSHEIQLIKGIMHESANWYDLSPGQQEALEMIATKLGRILVGDPDVKDSWMDIAGYARLACGDHKQEKIGENE